MGHPLIRAVFTAKFHSQRQSARRVAARHGAKGLGASVEETAAGLGHSDIPTQQKTALRIIEHDNTKVVDAELKVG